MLSDLLNWKAGIISQAYSNLNSSIKRQKGEFQKEHYKKNKYAKFSEKRTLLTPFQKIWFSCYTRFSCNWLLCFGAAKIWHQILSKGLINVFIKILWQKLTKPWATQFRVWYFRSVSTWKYFHHIKQCQGRTSKIYMVGDFARMKMISAV